MKKFYKVNQYIQADKVRVISDDEGQIGIMNRDEAIFKARQQKKDLVLVAENAKPPVAKIIDFNKFKYKENKKQQSGKKKSTEQKEIRFTPFIAENDFQTRIKQAKDFLKNGHKIKFTVKFTGRQITRKEFGYELLKKAANAVVELGTQQTEPKLQGKLLWIIIASKK